MFFFFILGKVMKVWYLGSTPLSWIYTPSSNSGKWRFIAGFTTKHVMSSSWWLLGREPSCEMWVSHAHTCHVWYIYLSLPYAINQMWLNIPYLDSMGWISYNPKDFFFQTGYFHLQVCPWSTYCVSIGQFGAIGESRSGILNVPGWAGSSLRLESMFFFFECI